MPHQDELPLGDDAIELVRDPAADTADADWIAADGAAPVDQPLPVDWQSDEEPADVEPPAADEPAEEPAAEEEAPRSARGKRKGRSSIPSWDEIMFGGQSE